MDRSLQFRLMEETWSLCKPIVTTCICNLQRQYRDSNLKDILFFAYQSLSAKQVLRPYLLRLGYEIAGGTQWKEIAELGAVVQLANISTYQSNSSFDFKNGVTTDRIRNNQFIASVITQGCAFELLQDSSYGLTVKNSVLNKLLDAMSSLYIGQFMDINNFSVDLLETNPDYQTYLSKYLERCKRIGGSLTSFSLEAGSLLVGEVQTIGSQLREIGRLIGTAGQIINDLADFAPTHSTTDRMHGENFFDFKNGKVTLPLYLLYMKSDILTRNKILNNLGRLQDLNFLTELTYRISSSEVYEDIKRILRSIYKKVRTIIKQLPSSDARSLLLVHTTVMTTNRFFHQFSNCSSQYEAEFPFEESCDN